MLGSFGSRQYEDALTVGWSGQTYLVLTAGSVHGGTISAITPSGAVTAPQQVIAPNSEHRVDTPAVQCGTAGCIATWHSLRYFFDCCSDAPEYENNRMALTDLSGRVLSQVPLTDAVGATPALSVASVNGGSVFIYGSSRGMFAGRMTAAGVVLDTPAVNGGIRVMNSATSFALRPVTVAYSGLYFIEPDNATNGRLYWTRVEPEPAPHVTTIVDLHQSVPMPPGWDQSMIRFVPLTASARNTYLVYSRGEDDATLMAPRLFLRTLASPDTQPSLVRHRAAR